MSIYLDAGHSWISLVDTNDNSGGALSISQYFRNLGMTCQCRFIYNSGAGLSEGDLFELEIDEWDDELELMMLMSTGIKMVDSNKYSTIKEKSDRTYARRFINGVETSYYPKWY